MATSRSIAVLCCSTVFIVYLQVLGEISDNYIIARCILVPEVSGMILNFAHALLSNNELGFPTDLECVSEIY